MWKYAQVERALAALHEADPTAQKGPLRGRIKHLQRLGIPLGLQPGRGKSIDYGYDEVFQFAICLELAEFGVDPVTIKSILEENWIIDEPETDLGIRKNIYDVLSDITEDINKNNDLYFVIIPDLMSNTWTGRRFASFTKFQWLRRENSYNIIQNFLDRRPRLALINMSGVIRSLFYTLVQEEKTHGLGSQAAMENIEG